MSVALDGIKFRPAEEPDLPAIVELLVNDPLGRTREKPADGVAEEYRSALAAITADPNQYFAVAVDGERVIGCLQLSFIPGLSRTGMMRGQIESVRVSEDYRGQGLGKIFIAWAIDQARDRGCGLVQLTSDLSRPDAIRFYERLGFTHSHAGMKLDLK